MSISTSTTIWCDDPACNDWFGGEEGYSYQQVLMQAKSRGWIRKGRKDYCPDDAPSAP